MKQGFHTHPHFYDFEALVLLTEALVLHNATEELCKNFRSLVYNSQAAIRKLDVCGSLVLSNLVTFDPVQYTHFAQQVP